jgi:hypothetical protein
MKAAICEELYFPVVILVRISLASRELNVLCSNKRLSICFIDCLFCPPAGQKKGCLPGNPVYFLFIKIYIYSLPLRLTELPPPKLMYSICLHTCITNMVKCFRYKKAVEEIISGLVRGRFPTAFICRR